ncbi:MAG: glycosyltransferase family 4 protein, partial [Saprospiraceae bacterium]
MKIALVSQEYPPETARGGIGSQTYMKAKGLSSFGHEIFVISRSLDLHRHETIDDGINVIRIPGLEDKLWDMTDTVQWITHSVVVALEIDALHKRVGLDLIDFPEWAAEGYVHLLNRMTHNYIPVVIQLHGPLIMFSNIMGWPEVSSEFYRIGINMESTCVQLADAVYSSSECSAKWVKSYYNPNKETIPVIHLGVNTHRFAPGKEIKNKRPTIISIGKLVQNKGVEELVSAA